MITLRQYQYPILHVYYEDKLIGYINNEVELCWFRTDIIGQTDFDKYHIKTPQGNIITFDKYGIHDYLREVEEYTEALPDLVEKQMALRIEDHKNESNL